MNHNVTTETDLCAILVCLEKVTERDSPYPETRAEGRVSNDGQGRAGPGSRRVSQNVQVCVLGIDRYRAHTAQSAHIACSRIVKCRGKYLWHSPSSSFTFANAEFHPTTAPKLTLEAEEAAAL